MLVLHEWKYKSILHASPDVVKRGQRLDLPGIGTNTGPTSPEGKAAVEPADCRQDMGGSGPLDALRFESAESLTGGHQGVEEVVASPVAPSRMKGAILPGRPCHDGRSVDSSAASLSTV